MTRFNFNTSHVTVYQSVQITIFSEQEFQYIPCYGLSILRPQVDSGNWAFQYISCYGLSKQMVFLKSKITHFNTSHVTVYPWLCDICTSANLISIHLMLRFISKENCGRSRKATFQYISCYGLSSFIWFFVCSSNDFNTSHVTVYLVQASVNLYLQLFQYISCYGLSRRITVDKKMAIEFQYISCYGLSKILLPDMHHGNNFNTSHVTVYLMILSHSYLGIFHHFLYSTSFQHFLPADYKI